MTAVDLITFPHHSRDPLLTYDPLVCHGAYAFDRKARTVHRYLADVTILATGGIGRIYRNTTNPAGARGDGLAMAHRAGARIVNCGICAVPPHHPDRPGSRRLPDQRSRARRRRLCCSPRMGMPSWRIIPRNGKTWLRAMWWPAPSTTRWKPTVIRTCCWISPPTWKPDAIRERFPNIYATCMKAGIDMTKEPIPVVPAAHYFCGGVLVDEWGAPTLRTCTPSARSAAPACTAPTVWPPLHCWKAWCGATALPGISPMSCQECAGQPPPGRDEVPQWDESGLFEDADPALIQGDMQTIQNIMWHYVGLDRSEERLSRAIRELRHLYE